MLKFKIGNCNKKIRDFLHCNLKKKFAKYEDMKPVSNQPGRIHATAKMHEFDLLDDNTIANLKFRPIRSQVGAYVYCASKGIIDYLKSFYENGYKMKGT